MRLSDSLYTFMAAEFQYNAKLEVFEKLVSQAEFFFGHSWIIKVSILECPLPL